MEGVHVCHPRLQPHLSRYQQTTPTLASLAELESTPHHFPQLFFSSVLLGGGSVRWGWEQACWGRGEHLPQHWHCCLGSPGSWMHFIPTWAKGSSESLGSPGTQSCLLTPWQCSAVKEWALFPFCILVSLGNLLALLLPFLLTLPVRQDCTFSKIVSFVSDCHRPRLHTIEGELQQERKNLVCR